MEIILKQDIQGLGYKNAIINVKPGYGRNYLIPQGYAIIANRSNKKMITENIRQAAHKTEKIKNDALALAQSIGDLVLEIGTKVGDNGKIFGSITALQVFHALKNKGFEIDKKKIKFEMIKQVGEYHATLDLHKEVKHNIKINIIAE